MFAISSALVALIWGIANAAPGNPPGITPLSAPAKTFDVKPGDDMKAVIDKWGTPQRLTHPSELGGLHAGINTNSKYNKSASILVYEKQGALVAFAGDGTVIGVFENLKAPKAPHATPSDPHMFRTPGHAEVVPVQPSAEAKPSDLTIDQLFDAIEKLQVRKADLERQQRELIKFLYIKGAIQKQRLDKLLKDQRDVPPEIPPAGGATRPTQP